MAILEILKYPDPVLKRVALPVQDFGEKTVQLVNDMLETMYAARVSVWPHLRLVSPNASWFSTPIMRIPASKFTS